MELATPSSALVQSQGFTKARVRQGQSFLRFLMPVAFPEAAASHRFEQRCEKLANSGRWQLLKGEPQSFLPHVRMHFNTVRQDGKFTRNESQPDRAPILNPAVAFGYVFKEADPSRLPLPCLTFSFRLPGTDRRIAFRVTGVQLGIFRMGVGFVSIEIVPISDMLPDWLDTLHFLRFYRNRGGPLFPAERQATPDGTSSLKLEDLLQSLLSEAALDGETLPFPPWANDARQLPSARIRELYVPGELLTYAALFTDGVAECDRRQLLYHVLNRFRSSTESTPGETFNIERWCLPYQNGQHFVNSIQGSTFVAIDAARSSFISQNLPAHLKSTYFVLFLLALVQRFALDQVSEAVAWSTGHVLADPERGQARRELERVTALDSQLLDFTGRCYFVQVSQAEHHHRYYARLREVNQIEDRYREVTDEVHALRAHASSRVSVEAERTSFRVGTALMVITCVLLPVQVLEALISTKLPYLPGIRDLSPTSAAAAAGLVVLFSIGMTWVIIHGNRRRHRKAGDQQ
jgi:hypothetical protein